MDFATPQFWLAALEIIVINILLSGDNAVVIALACRNLPPAQRRWGVFWGAIGAILLRILLTFFAVSLLQLSWLKIVGGVLLVWIGVKLIAEEEGDGGHEVPVHRTLGTTQQIAQQAIEVGKHQVRRSRLLRPLLALQVGFSRHFDPRTPRAWGVNLSRLPFCSQHK